MHKFLDINTDLLKHATRALHRASEQGRFEQLFARYDSKHAKRLFFQVYLALREVEVRELKLLHEIAVLEQMLRHEAVARQKEQGLQQQFKAQEQGNGKRTVIISPDDLEAQEKVVNKDRKRAQEATVEMMELFLAQHQTLVQTGKAFQTLDAAFVLVDGETDRKMLRLYKQIGGNKTALLKRFQDEVDGGKPLKLAETLEDSRKALRQHLTELSNARRAFAAVIHRHIPMIGVT